MYSEEDINSAVTAGALSADAAASFRAHMTKVRELPRGSEEDFRLINSFNDIFVSIGIVILLLAVGAIGQALAGLVAPAPAGSFLDLHTQATMPTQAELDSWASASNLNEAFQTCLAGLLVAVAAWPLAEFFTRRRRMALPSILLLLAFVGGVFAAVLGAEMAMVAGAAGVAVTVIALILSTIGTENTNETTVLALVCVAGLAVFAFAMRWDVSDRERITRRSDVAFWLHLLAAPMIAHPIFALLGVTEGDNLGVGAAVGVLAVYISFGLIALAIDRRALLVSALAYVLFALTFLFREFGAVELNFALTALVIGSALLSLSAFWQPIRRSVVSALPEALQEKLPATYDAPLPAAAVAA